MYSCFICIGSNYNREENIPFAQRKLKELFPDIRFGIERETVPMRLSNPALFTNQIALFQTESTQEEISGKLKEIEREAGRLPKDKLEEKICLDIDLVTYGDKILRPNELKRKFVADGILELFT